MPHIKPHLITPQRTTLHGILNLGCVDLNLCDDEIL